MKKLVVLGLLCWLGLAGNAEAGVIDGAASGIKAAARAVITVTHDVLHLADKVVDGAMSVVHASLDVLGIPFQNGS